MSPQGHIRQRGKIVQLSVVYDISPQNKLETCFRVPARMVVRRPAPINKLFNDESIAVQI